VKRREWRRRPAFPEPAVIRRDRPASAPLAMMLCV
jgi:hypothetical protein